MSVCIYIYTCIRQMWQMFRAVDKTNEIELTQILTDKERAEALKILKKKKKHAFN